MLGVPRKFTSLLLFWLGIFIVMDISLLGFNILISKDIDEDAKSINIAGRQRMLSQRFTKGILSIDESWMTNEIPDNEILEELKESYHLFNSTLLAFQQGGVVMGTNEQNITLAALEGEQSRGILDQASVLWEPIRLWGNDLFSNKDKLTIEKLSEIRSYALENNEELLTLMNDLTTTLENQAKTKTSRIRIFQSIAIIFAMVGFVVLFYQAFQRLRFVSQNEKFLRILLDSIDTCVLSHNKKGEIINCNQRSTDLFGFQRDELIGKNINSLIKNIKSDLIGYRKDGSCFFASMDKILMSRDNRPEVIKTIRDITPQMETENILTQMAYFDPITNLPNRSLLRDRIIQSIGQVKRNKRMLATLFIDLDGFKAVNDSVGHDIGDQVLNEVAKKLLSSIRQSDTVARWGGDEFIIIYPDIENLEDCEMLAINIIKLISNITEINNNSICLGASIGISIYPLDSSDPESLISLADAAMYEAKKLGKNNYRFHQNIEEISSFSY